MSISRSVTSLCKRKQAMDYAMSYMSPLGEMTLACDDIGLTGVWFHGQKYFGGTQSASRKSTSHSILMQTAQWLDRYFAGEQPENLPPLHCGGTVFRQQVWQLLLDIPYGVVVTYGELAQKLAQKQGKRRMSAQAVGGAVGHNPISILIPCHRVIGADGSLTGYAGGIARKAALLRLEGAAGWTMPE